MPMITQTSLRFVPDGPIENKPLIMQVMVWCLTQICVKLDFFYKQICQHSIGVKTWTSNTSLKNNGMKLLMHALNQTLRLKASVMDTQQVIQLNIKQCM